MILKLIIQFGQLCFSLEVQGEFRTIQTLSLLGTLEPGKEELTCLGLILASYIHLFDELEVLEESEYFKIRNLDLKMLDGRRSHTLKVCFDY